jgi:predicted dehydrogenase
LLSRKDARAKHIVQAIGSSSTTKGKEFAQKFCSTASPSIYGSYEEVYQDPNVDIVYLGTPHALHLQNALDAINAGKHVLCEKPLTINSKEAATMIAAARAKGVFLMEGTYHPLAILF